MSVLLVLKILKALTQKLHFSTWARAFRIPRWSRPYIKVIGSTTQEQKRTEYERK